MKHDNEPPATRASEAETETLRGRLAACEAALLERNRDLAEAEAAHASQAEALRKLASDNAAQAENIRIRFAELARLTELIETERAAARVQKAKLNWNRRKLAEAVAAQKDLVSAMEKQRKASAETVVQHERKYKEFEAKYRAILESRTWRATAPIRKILSGLKRRK